MKGQKIIFKLESFLRNDEIIQLQSAYTSKKYFDFSFDYEISTLETDIEERSADAMTCCSMCGNDPQQNYPTTLIHCSPCKECFCLLHIAV